MKILLLVPPQWIPFSPPLGVPTLTAFLRKNGYEVIQKDVNVEFYNHILSREYISGVKKHVEGFVERCNRLGADTNPEVLPLKERFKYQSIISELSKDLKTFWPALDLNTERSMRIVKNEELFYQPLFLAEAIYHFKHSLLACGLAFFPSDLMLNFYYNFNYKLNLDSIKEAAEDKDGNIFLNYYNEGLLEEIGKTRPDVVGISMNCNSQFVAGLTLAKKIKDLYPHIHVTIGGNAFTRLLDVLQKKPEFFNTFADTVVHGEGEIALLELVKALEGNKDFSKVPGLVYNKDGATVINETKEPEDLDSLPTPDFNGLDLSLYMSPDIIFPLQTSRGCYWRKCSFCDHDYGNKYAVKSPNRVIQQIKKLKDRYGAKNFYFVDESISPHYMRNLSKKIIENDLKISWFTCARAEEGFTEEVANLAAQSGLKLVLWGLESGSDRILQLINKGMTKDIYMKALGNTSKAGIWNHAFVFFGFPSETHIEAMETVNMLVEHKDIINSYGMGPFSLGKHSPIARNLAKYFIDNVEPLDEELITATAKFTTTEGMSREEVEQFRIINEEYCREVYGYPLWMSIGGYKEYTFFYLDKYGPRVLSYTPDETVIAFGSF